MAKSKEKERRDRCTVAYRVFTIVLQTLCWIVPIAVVGWINLEAAAHKSPAWILASVMTAILGPACIYMLHKTQGVSNKLQFAAAAVVCLGINATNAIDNLAAKTEGSRDSLAHEKQTALGKQDQLSQTMESLKTARANSERQTASYWEGKADELVTNVENVTKWRKTDKCTQKVNTWSAEFCQAYGALVAKKRAADEAVTLEATKRTLDAELAALPAPNSKDPFADYIASLLMLAGHNVSENGKVLISQLKVLVIAIGTDFVIGELGPPYLMRFLAFLMAEGAAHGSTVPAKKAKPEEVNIEHDKLAEGEDDVYGKFLRECTEQVQGSFVLATPLYETWCSWCAKEGLTAGEQSMFGRRMRERLTKPGKGKPRYLHIKLREIEKPKLRVISN